MERQSLYERFKILSWQQPIGNIASTLLKQSGFIGCADGDPNLSINYKRTLKIILNKKHDHRCH